MILDMLKAIKEFEEKFGVSAKKDISKEDMEYLLSLFEINFEDKKMSNTKIYEIHIRSTETLIDLENDNKKDGIYATIPLKEEFSSLKVIDRSEVFELDPHRIAVKYVVNHDEELTKMDIVRYLSCDFSNAFIIISPNEDQDIIVDFTLLTDPYFKLIDELKTETEIANAKQNINIKKEK